MMMLRVPVLMTASLGTVSNVILRDALKMRCRKHAGPQALTRILDDDPHFQCARRLRELRIQIIDLGPQSVRRGAPGLRPRPDRRVLATRLGGSVTSAVIQTLLKSASSNSVAPGWTAAPWANSEFHYIAVERRVVVDPAAPPHRFFSMRAICEAGQSE